MEKITHLQVRKPSDDEITKAINTLQRCDVETMPPELLAHLQQLMLKLFNQ